MRYKRWPIDTNSASSRPAVIGEAVLEQIATPRKAATAKKAIFENVESDQSVARLVNPNFGLA